ncbi:MAG TPA: gamma-glutamyl-gamma-aminobutyrate hydrolase family protein [Nevskiaceae bacterium]
MARPWIGLGTGGRNEQGRYELAADYSWCVYRAGGLPLLIPPVGKGAAASAWTERLDAFVFTGGRDLDPRFYGEPATDVIDRLDPERDEAEMALMRAALDSRKPILAICRGMQVLNVALGGNLYPDIPAAFGTEVIHRLPPHEPTTHGVQITPQSRLAALMGATQTSGISWHHQALRDVARGLVAVAHAPDGVIEAVETTDEGRWLFGIQWHPEITAAKDPAQQRIFDALVGAAAHACVRAKARRRSERTAQA